MRCRPSTPASSRAIGAGARRTRSCAAVSPPARHCPPMSAAAGERYGVETRRSRFDRDAAHLSLQCPDDVRYGTSGRPVPGYEMRIVGDDGEEVAARRDRRVAGRGPICALMYWNSREQVARDVPRRVDAIGDKYIEDADGYYTYCGRRDDMLKVARHLCFAVRGRGRAAHTRRGARSGGGGVADDEGGEAEGFVVLKEAGKAGDALAADAAASTSRRSLRPTSTRAGSSSRPTCQRQRPEDPALQAA